MPAQHPRARGKTASRIEMMPSAMATPPRARETRPGNTMQNGKQRHPRAREENR